MFNHHGQQQRGNPILTEQQRRVGHFFRGDRHGSTVMGSGIRDDALYLLNGDALEKLGRDLLRGEVVGVIQYRV